MTVGGTLNALHAAGLPGSEALCIDVHRTDNLTPEEFMALFEVEERTEASGEVEEDQNLLSVNFKSWLENVASKCLACSDVYYTHNPGIPY